MISSHQGRVIQWVAQALLVLTLGWAVFATGGAEVRAWAWAPTLPLALLSLCCALAAARARGAGVVLPSRGVLALLAFGLGWAALCGGLAPSAHDASVRLRSMAQAGAVFLAAPAAFPGRHRRRLVHLLLALGGLAAAVGLLHYLGVVEGPWPRAGGGLLAPFGNHNHAAGLLELLVPLAAALALADLEPDVRTGAAYLTLMMVGAHVFTLSRAGWIALAVGLGLLGLVRGGRRLPALALGFGAAVLLLLFQLGEEPVDRRLATLASPELLSDQGTRAALWRAALGMGLEHPLLGVGPGCFAHAFPAHRPPGMLFKEPHVHDDYLQALAEGGVPGFLAFLGLVVLPIRAGLSAEPGGLDRFVRAALTGAACGLAALAAHALADFNFHLPGNALPAAALAGFCLTARATEGGRGVPGPAALVALALFAVSVPVQLAAWREGALLAAGRGYLGEGRYEEARDAAAAAADQVPGSQAPHVLQAQALSAKAGLARAAGATARADELGRQAVEAWRAARRLCPPNLNAWVEEGRCLAALADGTARAEGLRCLEGAYAADHENAYFAAALAFELARQGQGERAVGLLAALYSEQPQCAPPLDAALDVLRPLLPAPGTVQRLVPAGSWRGHLTLARHLAAAGRRAEADAELEAALSLAPTEPAALEAAASARGGGAAARPLWERLYAVAPTVTTCLRAAAAAAEPLARREWLERAVAVAPKDARALTALARDRAAQGEVAGARELLEEAARLAPTDPAPCGALAELAEAGGERAAAVGHRAEACRRRPGDALLADALARTYLRIGMAQKALEVWRRALAEQPAALWLHERLASAQYDQPDLRGALRTLEAWAAVAPADQAWRGRRLAVAVAELRARLAALDESGRALFPLAPPAAPMVSSGSAEGASS